MIFVFHTIFATVHYCFVTFIIKIVINLVNVTKQEAGPYMKCQIRKLDPQCQCVWGKLFLIVPTTNRCISCNTHTIKATSLLMLADNYKYVKILVVTLCVMVKMKCFTQGLCFYYLHHQATVDKNFP